MSAHTGVIPQTSLSTGVAHGTGAIGNQKEFVVDMKDVIYRLDPMQNPFLLMSNMFPKVTAFNTRYEWMQREGYARRTFVAKIITGAAGSYYPLAIQLNPKDWNAIAHIANDLTTDEAAGNRVRIHVFTQGAGISASHCVGLLKRSAYVNGHMQRKIYGTDGTAFNSGALYDNVIQLSKNIGATGHVANFINTTNEAEVIADVSAYTTGAGGEDPGDGSQGTATWSNGAFVNGYECYVQIEHPNMIIQGYKEGSGLGAEAKKLSTWYYNYTQIFKTVVSVTGTQQACRMIGGSERQKRQFESGQSHASDLEWSILFQGGGVEGLDWGILDSSENPKRRFKGLGVGHASGKEGFIVSNNGNPAHHGGTATGMPCQVTPGSLDSYISLMERLFDDMKNGSDTKTMFCGIPFIKDLTTMALSGSGGSSYFSLQRDVPYSGAIGLNINRVITPFGNLDMVLHPMFNGPYVNYGLILDMKNISIRPLNDRDTKLYLNVGSSEIDGVIDQYLTEWGLEVRFEHTHAIPYLARTLGTAYPVA